MNGEAIFRQSGVNSSNDFGAKNIDNSLGTIFPVNRNNIKKTIVISYLSVKLIKCIIHLINLSTIIVGVHFLLASRLVVHWFQRK